MIDKDKIREGMKLILEAIGEDVNRDGLIETPDRIARMYEEIFFVMGAGLPRAGVCRGAELCHRRRAAFKINGAAADAQF